MPWKETQRCLVFLEKPVDAYLDELKKKTGLSRDELINLAIKNFKVELTNPKGVKQR